MINYEEFINRHLVVDINSDGKSYLKLENIAVINAKTGRESIELARWLNMEISSLMLASGSGGGLSGVVDQLYITFVNKDDKSFINVMEKVPPLDAGYPDYKIYYYDSEFGRMMSLLNDKFSELLESKSGIYDHSVSDLYASFGMEK